MECDIANQQILGLVKEIADGMRDPDFVKSIVQHPDNQNPDPIDPGLAHDHWSDLSLGGGYPGVILLLAELDRLYPNEKWDAAVHAYVLKIKESIETKGISSPSMYGGLAGVCFALQLASRGESRYKRLISTLNVHLLQEVRRCYMIPLQENLRNRQPSPMSLYDAIQGLSGIGVYYLNNLPLPSFRSDLEEILRLLIALTQPLEVEGRLVPGWYVASHDLFLEEDRKRYTKGNFNLGLAHGVPGILAFLSIASLRGVLVEGQNEAVEYIAAWLQSHCSQYNDAYFWRTVISFEEETNRTNTVHSFSGRDAWCYGTPGVSSALFLAGKALQNEQIKTFALNSFLSVFTRTRKEWFLPGPTFCHGFSGLLLITHEIARGTSSVFLEKQVKMLAQDLLQFYSASHPFGFKEFELSKSGKYAQIDQAGLLEGASGVLLTLLSLGNPTSGWAAPFLIGEGA